jgi:predicted metal-dependent peptidase
MTNAIERVIYKMYKNEEVSFIGTTLQCMTIRLNDFIPTAGVCFNKEIKQFELIVNPKWFDSLPTDENRIAIFVHELNHIFFKHVFIPQEIVLAKNKTKLNISMDLVINQFIKNLPEGVFIIEKIKDKNGKLFEKNLTFEGYYDLLDDATMEVSDCSGDPQDHDSFKDQQKQEQKGKGKQKQKAKGGEKGEEGEKQPGDSGEGSESGENGQQTQGSGEGSPSHEDREKHTGHNCDGSCKGRDGDKKPGKGTKTVNVKDYYEEKPFDTHGWSEADPQDSMEATRDLIKRSMQKASFSGTKVPGHIQDCLEEVQAQLKKLNYKELLMRALKQSLPSKDIEKTWKRPSRRLGDIAKGNMCGKMPKLQCHIDTSGSISIVEANEFLAVTNNFMTVGVSKADLYLWHTEIYHHEKIKKNFKVKPESFQSGGTDLQPTIDHLAKTKPDLAIIITDGYYGNTVLPKGFNVPIVFVISKQGTKDHPLHKYGISVTY